MELITPAASALLSELSNDADKDLFRSSSNMSSLLQTIAVLDGSNCQIWKANMTAYLQSQGLWSVVNGTYPCPVALVKGTTTITVTPATTCEQTDAQGRVTSVPVAAVTEDITITDDDAKDWKQDI